MSALVDQIDAEIAARRGQVAALEEDILVLSQMAAQAERLNGSEPARQDAAVKAPLAPRNPPVTSSAVKPPPSGGVRARGTSCPHAPVSGVSAWGRSGQWGEGQAAALSAPSALACERARVRAVVA